MKSKKCRFAHCLHDSREIRENEEYVKVGSAYYHKDCYKTNKNIKEIIDLFSKEINPNVVYSKLSSIIRKIVFERGNDSELLLFGVKYYLKKNIPLNYPQGLFYVMQNKDMIREYYKQKASTVNTDAVEITDDIDLSDIKVKPVSIDKRFSDVLI